MIAKETNNTSTPENVPYVVYRDQNSENRWVVERLVKALIWAVILVFLSNIAWLVAWNLYDYSSVETTIDSEGDGIANYTGGDGGVTTYGENYSPKDNQDETLRLDRNETSGQDAQEVMDEPG